VLPAGTGEEPSTVVVMSNHRNILHVVGARPNFMKAAPVLAALSSIDGMRQTIVHTGQHYDFNMSEVFFQQLGMPVPDINLQVGSSSHAQQTAEIISGFEPVVLDRRPDLVVVYGDVNSTVAAALVCSKLLVPVAHVEAGLRSFDRTMPEEINRLLTDQMADLLFTPSVDGNINLQREAVSADKIHLVGNVMIDTLIRMLPKAKALVPADLPASFALVTLHRPSNVDDIEWLQRMLHTLAEITADLPVIFPVHPRTRQKLSQVGLNGHLGGVRLLDPMPYLDFLALQTRATVVITDSGGIQEETTFLGTPCLTVRENTERPITIECGTNTLVGRSTERLMEELRRVVAGHNRPARVPPLWDGHASQRIAIIIASAF
jgi:UDP-N-acetylglucosamine 2-epimerase (non-hydrolysing)